MTQEIIDHLNQTIATTTSTLVRDYSHEQLITFVAALALKTAQEENPQLGAEEITITHKRTL